MKTKFIFIILVSLIVSFLCNTIELKAVEENICTLKLDSITPIKSGDTAEIVLNVSNINQEKGIVSLNVVIEYDKQVFENPQYETDEKWNKFEDIDNVLFITTTSMEPTKENSNILKIKLNTKNGAKPGEYQIKLTKITVVGEDNKEYDLQDVDTAININKSEDENENLTNNNVLSNSSNTEYNDYIKNSSDKDTTLSDKILSQTGIIGGGIIIIISSIGYSIFSYFKYKKNK